MQIAHALDPNTPRIEGARVGILQAKWYKEDTDRMVACCTEALRTLGAEEPEIFPVSGSLEFPIMSQTVLRKKPGHFDALICFGAILKGETAHFDMVKDGCLQGLMRVMLDESTPILIEVLPITDIEQLKKRSDDNPFNKGLEAAVAAAETIAMRRGL